MGTLQEKYSSVDISDTTVIAGKGNQKEEIGNSGVHLRYYKPSEYDSLTRPQKKELMEWRLVDIMGGAGGDKKSGGTFKKTNRESDCCCGNQAGCF